MTAPPSAESLRESGRDEHSPAARWVARLGPVLALCLVVGMFCVLTPSTFATVSNFELILRQTAVVGTAALGMTLIIISGGIDLSVGSGIALGTIVIARLLAGFDLPGIHVPPMPPIVALLGGVASGALCGCLAGGLITGVRLAPFIATLGLFGALRGAAKGLADNGMIYPPATWLNRLLQPVNPSRIWLLTPGAWTMLILAGFVALALRYTRFGRHIFAIGSNEQTARLCGVAVGRTKLLIYVVAGCFFGLAATLQFSYLTMGDPTTAMGMELNIIAAVVIGGASLSGGSGSVAGSLVGALIMTVIGNGCTKLGLDNYVEEIVTGAIIVVAVALDRVRQRYAG